MGLTREEREQADRIGAFLASRTYDPNKGRTELSHKWQWQGKQRQLAEREKGPVSYGWRDAKEPPTGVAYGDDWGYSGVPANQEASAELALFLRRLPPKRRSMVEAYMQGYNGPEIAQMLSCSKQWVDREIKAAICTIQCP